MSDQNNSVFEQRVASLRELLDQNDLDALIVSHDDEYLSYELNEDEENIRVTGLYPPDFELTGLDSSVDSQCRMGERLLNGRSVWEAIRFVLVQPRSCHISSLYFQGPTREDLSDRV